MGDPHQQAVSPDAVRQKTHLRLLPHATAVMMGMQLAGNSDLGWIHGSPGDTAAPAPKEQPPVYIREMLDAAESATPSLVWVGTDELEGV